MGDGSRIVIAGIRAQGRHGASPGERLEPQEFVVDLDVTVEVLGDSLAGTADYRGLAESARREVMDKSFELLESLAESVARAARNHPRVSRASATVHKPSAARSMGVGDVSAHATVE